jgi:hypothetical protein
MISRYFSQTTDRVNHLLLHTSCCKNKTVSDDFLYLKPVERAGCPPAINPSFGRQSTSGSIAQEQTFEAPVRASPARKQASQRRHTTTMTDTLTTPDIAMIEEARKGCDELTKYILAEVAAGNIVQANVITNVTLLGGEELEDNLHHIVPLGGPMTIMTKYICYDASLHQRLRDATASK